MPCGSYQKSRCVLNDGADRYALFYGAPIECIDRDAAYLRNGLLHNESENLVETTETPIAFWHHLISNEVRSSPTYDWVGS
jgi:hypothetical protein